jgi:cytochrome b involved in lipid metabolism
MSTRATSVRLLVLASLGLTALVGCSSATSESEEAVPSLAASAPAASAPAASTSSTITMADVEKHAAATDCWTVVAGNVYDLTAWIDQHPGGPDYIAQMCGTDATAGFQMQHEGQGEPNEELADFQIGVLG